jgi:phosphoribosylglycinamide formyltransferase-1
MPSDFDIVVIISGRGSNLKSLLESARNYRISAVLSNTMAPGLAYGRERNIPCYAFPRDEFSSVAEQKAALFAKVESLAPKLVCLAGYMQIVPSDFVLRYFGKIVNIHPSLLPDFPGLDTHRRALEAEAEHHGCTVHFVDSTVDTGPIIAQSPLQVMLDESEDALAGRVLALEHRLYPWAVNGIASGEIWLEEGAAKVTPALRKEGARMGLTFPETNE